MTPDKFDKKVSKLRPEIERLLLKIDSTSETFVTGFIFTTDDKGIVQFGNLRNRGPDLVQLHKALSILVAEIQAKNPTLDLKYANVAVPTKALCGESAEELADKMAKNILISGLESTQYNNEIMHMAERYLQIRHAEEFPTNGKLPPADGKG